MRRSRFQGFALTLAPQTVNKFNLESGGGVSDQLTRINHREARNKDREANREKKGGTWNLHVLFNLGTVEGGSDGQVSTTFSIYQVFTLILNSKDSINNRKI